jgi:hypothetical protein
LEKDQLLTRAQKCVICEEGICTKAEREFEDMCIAGICSNYCVQEEAYSRDEKCKVCMAEHCTMAELKFERMTGEGLCSEGMCGKHCSAIEE